MTKTDVLIVGAGPTGLVLALWLTKQGARVRLIDKSRGPGETSRAMAVQARTLELYRQLDLADPVIADGYKIPAVTLWARGRRRSQVPLVDAGKAISPYAFMLVYPQDRHERFLIDRLAALGVTVERETELIAFQDRGDHVVAVVRHAAGQTEEVVATYLAGCDGAHSFVRHQIGAGFEGGTYKQLFYVADVVATGVRPPGNAHIAVERSDFVLVFPYGETNRYRLIGTCRGDRADRPETLSFEDVRQDAIRGLGIAVETVNWFSTYRVHHRVTDRFRAGNVFLLGDAAHVHSPAGGQGMNTGILDAINLAWKMAAVIGGRAGDALLDTYEAERKAFAQMLVETTDRVFTFATAEGGLAEFVRTRIAPTLLRYAYRYETVRAFVFRTVSQTTISYAASPLSAGAAGRVRGGDRLPWVSVEGVDNHASVSGIGWQVHVYGKVNERLTTWCREQGLPLHVFAFRAEHRKAGLAENAAYLLRPDSYVGIADPGGNPAALDAYLKDRNILLTA